MKSGSEDGGSQELSSDGTSSDVYINFADGSREFTRCLLLGLSFVGIRPFMREENSSGGQAIGATHAEAIDKSKIAIVVLSEGYADSILCLDELTWIVERYRKSTRPMLLPVFYGVDPLDVKGQRGSFRHAFATSQRKEGAAATERWREALKVVCCMKGWMLHRRSWNEETSLVMKIVLFVSSQLSSNTVHAPRNLVEIESSQKAMHSLLDLDNDDVLMVGICGMGGIGKTALAKSIYGKISCSFERHCFLANVRETCEMFLESGLLQLQRKVLSQLMIREGDISDPDRGMNFIQQRLCPMKILLVIDDADRLRQLEILAGARNWFGPRSRIIITTRDRQLLDAHQVKNVYEVPLLESSDASRLFTNTVFQDNRESKDCRNLTNDVVDYAKGLPLTITNLGTSFRGKNISEWASILKACKRNPNLEILSILRCSFDGLGNEEKDIFLDLACFFKGQPVHYVKKILECCYSDPDYSIGVLKNKFLMSVKKGKVDMHEMLQKMGMEIVRQNSQNNPHYHSRLWDPDEVHKMIRSNMGIENVKGVKLDSVASVSFSPDDFKGMTGLRVFILQNAPPRNPIFLPEGVTWIEWPEYKFPSLPLNHNVGGELVGLYMNNSNIKLLEDDLKHFTNLKFINFSHCMSLRIIPDVSSLTNLESLDVEECKAGLQDLILKGCSKLTKFPEIQVKIWSLKELSLNETDIDDLPSSIENLIGLEELYLENCKNIEILPSSIYRLQTLQRVFLGGCSELHEFPVYVDGSNDSSSTSMPLAFPKMVNLELQRCGIQQIDFIKDFGCVSTLKKVDLSGSKIVTIPKCIDKFTVLEQLNLVNCKQLREIQGLPPNIKYLFAQGCESLERCVSLSGILKSHSNQSPRLRQFDFSGCNKLTQNESSKVHFISIEDLYGDSQIKILHPGSEIPMWFDNQSKKGSLSFSVDSRLYQKITGLAFCVVIGLAGKTMASFSCEFQLCINDEKIYDTEEFFHPLDSDHLWLVYVPCAGIGGLETKMQNMCNKFEVQFNLSRGNLT